MTLCTFGSRFAKTPKTGEPVELLRLDDWKSVFELKHDFDAHAWPYVRYLDGEVAPPVRVGCQSGKPTTEGDILCYLVFLDFDESDDHYEILARFTSVEDGSLPLFAAIYPTKSGMRFVYRLASPVLPDEYSQIARGLAVELFSRTGLKVDTTTDQWARCFRLPSVLRNDGKASGATWEQDYYFEPIITDVEVDPDDLPHFVDQLPWKKGRAAPKSVDEMPDLDGEVPETRLRVYKKHFRRGRFGDYIFDDLEIMPGRRDQTLMAMCSEIVGKSYVKIPDCSPGEIFLLLLPIVQRWEGGGEPEENKLWRMIQHCWNGEVEKESQQQVKIAAERSLREVVFDNLLKDMPKTLVPVGAAERARFASTKLFLQDGSNIYPIQADGTYSTSPLQRAQVTSYLNSSGLLGLAPDNFCTERGTLLNSSEILNRNSTIIDGVTFEPGPFRGARVVRSSGPSGMSLSISPFCLEPDLVERAEIDTEIEEWLDTFPDPPALKRWLAAALALDKGPTSSLYLMGPPRVGKTLLATALAECFGCQPVTGTQAFSNFNGALRHSPIILVDEGLPKEGPGGMSAPDLFRSLISGQGVSIVEKYMSSMQFNIPFRIVFTANSFEMVTSLIGDRPLTGSDLEAFTERISVMICDSKPADYLDSRGAMRFTKEDRKGSWIGGEKRLARHLIRNYQLHFEESEFIRDGRMLVAGRSSDALTVPFDLSGYGSELVDLLVDYLDKLVAGNASTVITGSLHMNNDGRVFVRTIPLLRNLCKTRNATRPAFSKALDRFLTGKKMRIQSGELAELDLRKLHICGASAGLNVDSVAGLVKRQVGHA